MGTASSAPQPKVIHLDIEGSIRKVIFTHLSSPTDVRDLVCTAAGVLRGEVVSLVAQDGTPIGIDPDMPINSKSFPYKVIAVSALAPAKEELVQNVFTEMAEHLSRALRVNEMKSELTGKLDVLERRVEVESLKAQEVERCKSDIEMLREEMVKKEGYEQKTDAQT